MIEWGRGLPSNFGLRRGEWRAATRAEVWREAAEWGKAVFAKTPGR